MEWLYVLVGEMKVKSAFISLLFVILIFLGFFAVKSLFNNSSNGLRIIKAQVEDKR
jgi:hypothetical protein